MEARTRAAHARHYKESPGATQEKMQKSRRKLTFREEPLSLRVFIRTVPAQLAGLSAPAILPISANSGEFLMSAAIIAANRALEEYARGRHAQLATV